MAWAMAEAIVRVMGCQRWVETTTAELMGDAMVEGMAEASGC